MTTNDADGQMDGRTDFARCRDIPELCTGCLINVHNGNININVHNGGTNINVHNGDTKFFFIMVTLI